MRDDFLPFPNNESRTGGKSGRIAPGMAAGVAASLGALSGCGADGGGNENPAGDAGDRAGTTAPVVPTSSIGNLTLAPGSEMLPINLSAGYFRDKDGAPLTFTVAGIEDSGLTFDAESNTISGAVRNPGSMMVTVTATNAGGDSASMTFTVTADTSAGTPLFTDDIEFERIAEEGVAIREIDVAAGFVDPDGDDDLAYMVEFTRDDSGLIFDPDTNLISGTFSGSEDVVAIATVSNGTGEDAPSIEHRILISPDAPSAQPRNMDPERSGTPLNDLTATQGVALASPIDLRAGFDDPDGDDAELTFAAWVVGEGGALAELSSAGLTLTGSMLSGTPDSTGNIVIRVTATDARGGEGTWEFTIAVAANRDPMVVGTPPAGVALTTGTGENLPIEAAAWFTDPDAGQTLTYSLIGAENTGLSIDERGGRITGPFIGVADAMVRVRAADTHGAAVEHALEITSNAAPTTTEAAPAGAMILMAGANMSIRLPLSGWFRDTDADAALTYSLADPNDLNGTGLYLDPDSGEIRGTYTGTADSTVRVKAIDEHGASVEHVLRIEANAAPTTTAAVPTGRMLLTTGAVLASPINAGEWFEDTDADQTLTFSLVDGTGTGLRIDGRSGAITGTFTGDTTATIRVRATDDHGAHVDHALEITANAAPTATREAPSGAVILTTGGELNPIPVSGWFEDMDAGATLTFSLVDPADLNDTGLTFDSASGEIRGTFTGNADASVRVRATDQHGAHVVHALQITANAAPMKSAEAPAADHRIVLTTGSAVNLPIDTGRWFSDADGIGTLTYSLVDPSNLDGTGLVLDAASGEIRGEFIGTGDVAVQVRASDGQESVEHAVAIAAKPPKKLTALPDSLVIPSGVPMPATDLSGAFSDPGPGTTWIFDARVGTESLDSADIGLSFSSRGVLSGTFTGTVDTVVTLTAGSPERSGEEKSFIVRTADPATGGRGLDEHNSVDEFLIGTIAQTEIVAGHGDDVVHGGPGDQTIYAVENGSDSGADQTDVALYDGPRDEYVFSFPTSETGARGITLKSNDAAVSGTDTLFGFDEIHFDDRKIMIGANGTAGHDIVFENTTAYVQIEGGVGDDILIANPDKNSSIARYAGDIKDFAFEFSGSLVITDADTGDGFDEGSDQLHGFEILNFDDQGGVRIQGIKFGSGNTGDVDANPNMFNIIHGEGGGYTFNGGSGIDIFQFLTAADSTVAVMTTIKGFNQSQGDRIALGKEIGPVTVTESGGNTIMANPSGFSLTIEGVGHGFDMGSHYYHIGVDNPITLTAGTELNLPIRLKNWFPDEGEPGELMISLVDPSDLDGTGLSFDSASGEIRGTFTGTEDATVRVRAGVGQGATEHEIRITAESPIHLTNLPGALVADVGKPIPAIDLSGVFSDPAPGEEWTFSAVVGGTGIDAAGVGLSLDSSGILSGTLNGAVSETFILTARDGRGNIETVNFQVKSTIGGEGRGLNHPSNADEFLIGSDEGNQIMGGYGDDLFYSGGGYDKIFGNSDRNAETYFGEGDMDTDVVVYSGMRDDYIFDAPDTSKPGGLGINVIPDFKHGGGRDNLIGIDEIRFENQALVVSTNGTDGHDIVLGTAGDDVVTGGAGDDILMAGNGGDDDAAVHAGDIRDFRFEMFELLAITDANSADGTDEGSDRLWGFEKLRFANGVEVNTANIKFGSGNSGDVNATDSTRNVLYGEGGGYTFNGGSGADIFQFLTSADSVVAGTTTIVGFDPSQGDRIALGREIGAVTITEVGGNTIMANSSGFSLTIEGAGLGQAPDDLYWHIGVTPAASSAVRPPDGEEIAASDIGDGRAPADDAGPVEVVSTIVDFAVDGDDGESAFGLRDIAWIPEADGPALFEEPDVPGDAAVPFAGCDDYVCSLGLT